MLIQEKRLLCSLESSHQLPKLSSHDPGNHRSCFSASFSAVLRASLYHATGLTLWLCTSIFAPKSSRIFEIPYRSIVGLSTDNPHAMTRTSSGSPMGRSISGRNTPELPISIHLFKPGWNPKISIDGSVYGLYAGLNLRFEM